MIDALQLEQRLKNIKAITFDVDGVLTDGLVLAMPDGDLLRQFNAKDAFALRLASTKGILLATITGGSSESVRKRMMMCGVKYENVYLHSRVKIHDFRDFCSRNGLKAEEVIYMGDDLLDIDTLRACGLAVVPADACPEVLEAADFIAPEGGGKGAVRHTVEMVLKAQGLWSLDAEEFAKSF